MAKIEKIEREPTFRLNLFGVPEMRWQTRPFTLSRRQARALLFRLAFNNQPVPREELSDLLWPDKLPTAARRNLTRLLSYLRGQLPHSDLLQTSQAAVTLNPDLALSDVVQFTQLCASDDPAEWETAVSLYHGLFLAGFTLNDSYAFDNWLSQEQRRLERHYLETLRHLITGPSLEPEKAIQFARMYLEIDDLAEDIHRQLITLYAANGDRSAALRQYEQCVIVLERELGVPPLPETRAVYEAVRDGRLLTPPQKLSEPKWATLPGLDLPLIGREAAWEKLETAYGRFRSGGVILISGEPGVGKSRLMQEFATHCAGLILSGNNEADEQMIPYQPLVQALRQALPLRSLWTHALPIWLADLARLMPELATHFPDLPLPADVEPQLAQAHMFEALWQIFVNLGTDSSLLLCLDNIQWADESTYGWLQYVTRQIPESNICILATYRTHQQPMLSEWRRLLKRADIMADIPLAGLTEPAVANILRQADDRVAAPETWAARIHAATGGNAFFVLETIRELLETDQLPDVPVNLPLPFSVRDTVLRRAHRLSPLAQQILEVTAVLSPSATFPVIHQVAGRDEMETAHILEELTIHQMLRVDGEQFRFQHDLARKAVYQNISIWRRQLLHRRVAHKLAITLQNELADIVTVAHHFEQAGDKEKATEYFLRAGEHAQNIHAFDVAIKFYEQALQNFQQTENHLHATSTLIKISLCYQALFEFQLAQSTLAESFRYHEKSLQNWTQEPKPSPQPLRLSSRKPVSLDPTLANDYGSSRVIDQLFSGLVQIGADNTVLPAVAKTWEIVDGGKTYIFHLREDVFWSDGQIVTSDDFLFAWKRSLNLSKRSPLAHVFVDVCNTPKQKNGDNNPGLPSGIYAPNLKTIVIKLNDPNSNFLYFLTKSFAYPVPKHMVEKRGPGWAESECIVTNGPYQIEQMDSSRFLRLTPSRNYFNELTGNTAYIDILWIESWKKSLANYEAGELDVLSLWNLPPIEMRRVRQRLAADYVTSPWFQNTYIVLNTNISPFADVRVRQAFVMALNRNYLSIVAKRGFDSPAIGGLIPPGMFAHSSNIGLPFNPEHARALLAEAGYANGQGFPHMTGIIFSAYAPIQEYLSQQWVEHLQVNVQWKVLDWVAYQKTVNQKPQDLVFTGWVADYPDPDNILRMATYMDRSGWHHPKYEALINAAKNLPSTDERKRMYQEADQILIEDVGVIPISYGRRHLLVKPWIKRFPESPLKNHFWKDTLIRHHHP